MAPIRGSPSSGSSRRYARAFRDGFPDAGHARAALCQRQHPPRPPGRVSADRRLRAGDERDRQGMHLHLRRRHPRHADRDQRPQGRRPARGIHRGHPPRARRGLQGVRHRLRSLLHHAFAGERTPRGAHLRRAQGRRSDRSARRGAGVLRRGQALPARPLHPRDLPGVRLERPVRGLVRALRQHVRAHRPPGTALRHLRQHRAGAAQLAALVRQAVEVPAVPARLDLRAGPPAARDQELRRQVARRALARLGHLARRALLRVSHSRREEQILLRLARRADRLPQLHRQVVPGARQAARGLLEEPRLRGGALHRQGHHLFPHLVLARDAARQRLERSFARARARHAHRRRREDEQVARHLPQRARLPARRARPGVAAVFLRREPGSLAERHRSLARRAEEPRQRRAARQRGEPRQPRFVVDLEKWRPAHDHWQSARRRKP